ncbi:MAG: hypothetical protein J0L80_02560 [Chitinophagales bacterium]|nr:hypothetical protein [Chitinophagales bacterium]
MLKTTTLAVVCCIFFTGCKKNDPITNTTNNTSNEDTTYIISGVNDISIGGATETKTMLVALSPVNSQQSRITLSVDGLPEYVSTSFDPTSGNIPFSSTIDFKNNYAKAGSYDLTVKGTSESGKTKSLKFKLTLPPVSCAEFLAKNCNWYSMRNESGVLVDSFAIFEYENNYLTIKRCYLDKQTSGPTIIAWDKIYTYVDCNTNEIIISEQIIRGEVASFQYRDYKVSGKGSYNRANKIVIINLTIVNTDNNISKKYTLNSTIRP